MKNVIACLGFAASAAISTAAFAASSPNLHDMGHPSSRGNGDDRCSLLQKQYDAVAGDHLTDASFEAASTLHSEGVSACQANQSSVGAEKLEQALRQIGIKPVE